MCDTRNEGQPLLIELSPQVNCNQLSSLPVEIGLLANLQWLDVRRPCTERVEIEI
jgi:hypothetical protein